MVKSRLNQGGKNRKYSKEKRYLQFESYSNDILSFAFSSSSLFLRTATTATQWCIWHNWLRMKQILNFHTEVTHYWYILRRSWTELLYCIWHEIQNNLCIPALWLEADFTYGLLDRICKGSKPREICAALPESGVGSSRGIYALKCTEFMFGISSLQIPMPGFVF